MAGILYVVGTPIGNLGDFSPRAVQVLSECDFIAAEDTRVTSKLLNHFGIKKPLISYYEHNRKERGEYIIDRILKGESCVLCSDAGMPLVSDPGEELVKQCYDAGIEVTCAPGPTALITALSLSGRSVSRFTFEGFLSTNKKNRRDHLEALKNEERTMVFYEAPHKLIYTLKDMYEYFGDRGISVCRELTKLHEEVLRTTLGEAITHFEEVPPKGEFVLVIDGVIKEADEIRLTLDEAIQAAAKMATDGMSEIAAAKSIAKDTGYKKSDIYNGMQRLK